MGAQWSKLVGFFVFFAGIILVCIVFGGYSSLHRSEGRIASAQKVLLSSCQENINLLPELSETIQNKEYKEILAMIQKAARQNNSLIKNLMSHDTPMDMGQIKKLETAQNILIKNIANLFIQIDQSRNINNIELFKTIKQKIFLAQDNISMAKSRYNMEVEYFNVRTKIFPGFIIAKIFGFDKEKYFSFSRDSMPESSAVFKIKA